MKPKTPKTFLLNSARHAKRMGWTEERFHDAIKGIKSEYQHLLPAVIAEYRRFQPRRHG